MYSAFCKKLRNIPSYFYHQRSSHILNYVTLKISDAEIEGNLLQLQADNFDRLYFPLLTMTTLVFLQQLVCYFFTKNTQLPSLLMSSIDLFNAVFCWGILRKFLRNHAPKFVLIFLVCRGIVCNLLYTKVVPAAFELVIDKSQYDHSMLFTMLIVVIINYNSLKFTVFLIFPAYFISTFLLTGKLVSQYVQESQYLAPHGFARTETTYLYQNKVVSLFVVGFVCVSKRYVELIEQSELVIEKAIIDRQQKQLSTFFMKQEDATIVYSVSSNQESENLYQSSSLQD